MDILTPEARDYYANLLEEMKKNPDDLDSVYRVAACYICGWGVERDTVKGAEMLGKLVIPAERHIYAPARPDECFKGETFREKLNKFYPDGLNGVDPAISGGWGYSMEDAVVIDPEITHPGTKGSSFFAISLEPALALHRGYMETIICVKSRFAKLGGITIEKGNQRLLGDDKGKTFDCVHFTISGYTQYIRDALVEEFEENDRYLPKEIRVAHEIIFNACRKSYEFDMYFDITKSFG